jgi:hypothetical protein
LKLVIFFQFKTLTSQWLMTITGGDNSHSQAKPDLHMGTCTAGSTQIHSNKRWMNCPHRFLTVGSWAHFLPRKLMQFSECLLACSRLMQRMYFMLKQKIDEKKTLDDVEPKNTVKQRWTRLGSMNDLRVSNIMMVFRKV